MSKFIRIGCRPDYELSRALFIAGCSYMGRGLVRCQNAMHARAMADWLEMEGIPATDEDDLQPPDLFCVNQDRQRDLLEIWTGF